MRKVAATLQVDAVEGVKTGIIRPKSQRWLMEAGCYFNAQRLRDPKAHRPLNC